MNLSQYLQILWRRKQIIIATALVATITATVGKLSKPPIYTTSATIHIPTITGGSQDYRTYDLNYSDRIMNTYVSIATSSPVLGELRDRLGIAQSEMPSVTAKALQGTELLQLTVQSTNPQLAQDAANTLADVMVSQRTVRNRLSVVQPAGYPSSPGFKDTILAVMLAVMAGTVGGAGLAFLYDGIDARVHTEEEIATLAELPVLASIPVDKEEHRSGYLVDAYPYSELFIRLCTNIFARKAKTGETMSFLVTSANPQEGKSTIVTNLAITIARTGQHVVLIDTDMRRPSLHDFFGHSHRVGLSTLLSGQAELKDVLQHTSIPNLDLIASGTLPDNPNVLLGSELMRNLLTTLKSQADVILIDTPAYLAVADVTSLVTVVDSVILIARRGEVRRKDLSIIRRELATAHSDLIGVVINRAEYDVPRPYRKYYQPSVD
ncbi:MAG: polysaccharide biosynthesis tyrosine autokinase [Anaerolineae bacterium]|nr:polysaccharide biosynthesis tyrosine autokinase [Anaerolineae bacterium]